MDLFERRQTLRDPTQMPPPTKVLVPLGPPSTVIVISLLFGFLKIKMKKKCHFFSKPFITSIRC